jgi:hypothetical protein
LKKATKKEKEYMSKVASLGCIVCNNLGYPGTEACIHHIREGQGMGQRGSHFDILPLCWLHHQGNWGIGIHGGVKEFERKFGTERELQSQVKEALNNHG